MFTQTDKTFGLELAKGSILSHFDEVDFVPPKDIPAIYKEERASFVTLKSNGNDLRGCIGSIYPIKELYKDIIDNAKNAAFNDPRFKHLNLVEIEEDKDFVIEVSVLTVPEKKSFKSLQDMLDSLEEEKPGVIINRGVHQATFLPDVWNEIPNPREFLDNLVMKSGYDPKLFWQDPFGWNFFLYTTQHWSDKWKNI